MSFNSIAIVNMTLSCNLSEQLALKQEQHNNDYWKAKKDVHQYLAFVGSMHCTFINTVSEIKQTNSATVSFSITLVPNVEKIDLDSHRDTIDPIV